MFWASRAAGPLIGVAPSGTDVVGAGGASARVGAGASAWLPFVGWAGGALTGSKPDVPESNRLRHSGSTLAGSRRYCS